MVTLHVDTSELRGFSTAMSGSAGILKQELITATTALGTEGVSLMQENVPIDQGVLRGSVTLQESGGLTASFGPLGVIYARIQNYGGTIFGRPWLVFQTKAGNWVKVRSVTIPATNYVQRTADALRPRVQRTYQAAVDRAIARMGL